MHLKKTWKWMATFAALACNATSNASVSITESKGWNESAYIEWNNESQYSTYHIYCRPSGGSYQLIDQPLVRDYGNYGRADILGLAAGNYQLKVVPVKDGTEVTAEAAETSDIAVMAHDRSGFAFTGKYTPGAYKENGQLKDNAIVIYLTEQNKETVAATIQYSSKASEEYKGIVNILTALKKGYETRPIDIRVIGKVTNEGTITSNSDFSGDIAIDLKSKETQLTIEGVGEDATAYGWGIRLKNCKYSEVRNLGFLNCGSKEGDNVGLQQTDTFIWVHHCDMFYGQPGGDADQVKGDGALDCKKSNFVTFSYNHFWDNGKCNLLGLSEGIYSYEPDALYITYHHNWYDHSDSRHPRVRYYNAHIYNNYYDGNAKYGAGSTNGSSLFMENNYFRNCKYPMLTSMQGSDLYAKGTERTTDNATFSKEDGGTIKAFGNIMTGSFYFIPYQAESIYTDGKSEAATVRGINTSVDFDAYVVDDASDIISDDVTSAKGAHHYSNFDTQCEAVLNAAVDKTEDVVEVVTGAFGAGRINHGDFEWTFSESDDASYAVDENLRSAIEAYQSSLKGFYTWVPDTASATNPTIPTNPTEDDEEQEEQEPTITNPTDISADGYTCYFTGGKPSNTTFYQFTNDNYSNSKGTVTIGDATYSESLKLESTTTISFTATKTFTLTLIFAPTETPSLKINGTSISSMSNVAITNNTVKIELLAAGNYTLTKENTGNLFFLSVSYGENESTQVHQTESEALDEGVIYDIYGRTHDKQSLQYQQIYIQKGRRFMLTK